MSQSPTPPTHDSRQVIYCDSIADLEHHLDNFEWFTAVCTEHERCLYSVNPDGEQHFIVRKNDSQDSSTPLEGEPSKNEYGQPVTDTGHVLTASELIEQELDKLLLPLHEGVDCDYVLTSGELPCDCKAKGVTKTLAAYVVEKEHNAAINHHRDGLRQGRREGLAMAQAAVDIVQKANDSNGRYNACVEIRQELDKAVEAIAKSEGQQDD